LRSPSASLSAASGIDGAADYQNSVMTEEVHRDQQVTCYKRIVIVESSVRLSPHSG
jgi:hypothetical protein